MLEQYYINKDSCLKFRYFRIKNAGRPYITTLDICDDFDDNLLVFIKTPDCEKETINVGDISLKVKNIIELSGHVTKNILFFTFIRDRSSLNLFQVIIGTSSPYKKLKMDANIQKLSFSDLEVFRQKAV